MQHRLPPAIIVTSSPLMTITKTTHLRVLDSETPNQRSEGEDQPECRHDEIEDTERRQWLYKKAYAQQPTAGSITSSNSSSSGGSSSSDGDDSDGMTPQHPVLSRSSFMAQWGEASSVMSEKAAVNVVKKLVEERGDDSPSKYQPQTHNVMNKAQDLCARIRHQAKVKQREERKRILFQRQKARDLARQAVETAREEEAREAALRLHAQKEVTKAAHREHELVGKQRHEDNAECSHASDQHHGHRTLSAWRKHAHASTRDQERLQAVESQVDMFYATTLVAREALHQRQAFVQQAKVFQLEEDKEGRLIQAAKMERLREGVLLWDRWVKQRAIFIWYVKAQHVRTLQHQHQHQHQQRVKQQQEKGETKARVSAVADAVTFAPSLSSFADWAVDIGKWLKWQVDRACAPPRRPKSPSHYLDEC